MIYMLEDDGGIRDFVLYALNNSGLDAVGFELPSEFFAALSDNIPDLLLLDVMLPEEDGISILKKLRSAPETERLPIILLTAKGTEFDKVLGLDSGADDYISKPFGTMELISRIKALLRRSAPISQPSSDTISTGGLTIKQDMHEVTADGKKVVLTLKEYDLLCLLMKNKGKVFTRDELLNRIWGYDFSGESRTVDVHIRTLRSKLGICGELIGTIRGVGYKIGEKNG
ncbi:MAG: response regulator transcription factor [Ruminococcus sp.]|nr:response regulator transcription factor [Ruminococcus sp.]